MLRDEFLQRSFATPCRLLAEERPLPSGIFIFSSASSSWQFHPGNIHELGYCAGPRGITRGVSTLGSSCLEPSREYWIRDVYDREIGAVIPAEMFCACWTLFRLKLGQKCSPRVRYTELRLLLSAVAGGKWQKQKKIQYCQF